MALNKAALESTILTMLQAGEGKSAAQAQEDFAEQLANAIDVFVKSGDVNAGILVQVTPATGTGATTGTGKMT